MKKLVLALLFLMAVGVLFAQHPVLVYITNADGSVPAAGEVTFQADRTEFPGEFLDHNTVGCGYSDAWAAYGMGEVTVNAGNYTTNPWQPGQTVRISITNTANGQTGYVEILTTSAGSDTWSDPNNPSDMIYELSGGGPTNYSVSGTITKDFGGYLAGVTVKAMDGATELDSQMTDANGDYTLTVADGTTIDIVPTKAGWTINPMTGVLVDGDLTGIDFTAVSPNPDMPANPFPRGTNIAMGSIMKWDAPASGAAVTNYEYTLVVNGGAPIVNTTVATMLDLSTIPEIVEGATVNASVRAFHNPDAPVRVNGKAAAVRGYGNALAWNFTMGVAGTSGGQGGATGSGNNDGSGQAAIDLPPVDDDNTPGGTEYDTGVVVDPTGNPTTTVEVVVTTTFGDLGGTGNGAGFVIGLVLTASNDWFDNTIEFDLGVDPNILFDLLGNGYLAYDAGSGWVRLNPGVAPLNDNEYLVQGTSIIFNPGVIGRGDIIFGGGTEDFTLPVELSSFSASFMAANNEVSINWKTASETNVLGFNVFRGEEANVSSAIQLNASVINAANTGKAYNFKDTDLEAGATYNYWLQSVDLDGTTHFFGPSLVTIPEGGNGEVPFVQTALLSAGPNPFNGKSANNFKVNYRANEGEKVTLKIYNVKGQLVESKVQVANGSDQNFSWKPASAASGVYFYQMQTKNFKQTKKLLIVR